MTRTSVLADPTEAGDACVPDNMVATAPADPARPLSVPRSFDILPEHPRGRSRRNRV